jgi:hypothetical protein
MPQPGPAPLERSLRNSALRAVDPAFELELSPIESLAQHGQALSWGVTVLALVAAVAIPWERIPLGPKRWTTTPDALNAALVGLWTVEATLFVLTATVTALLIGLFTEPTSRMELVRRYRRNAFDAAAVVALFAVICTSVLIVVVLGGESSTNWAFSHWLTVVAAVFVIDLLELAWLLWYTHQLLTEPPGSQTLRWTLALRDSFREEAVARMSRVLMVAWASAQDVEYEDFGSTPGQGRAAQVAGKSGYVHDVRLNKLAAWVHQSRRKTILQPAWWQFWAKHQPPAASAGRISIRVHLNSRAVQGTRLAWVDQRSVSTARRLDQAAVWTSRPPADPFPEALNQMRDRAVVAARDGQAGALEQVQDALESVYEETMRIESGINALPNPPPPRMFGWQPHVQLRIAVQRLGSEVLQSQSDFLINQWLYFVQELLRILRPYSGMAREIMYLWAIAGTRPTPPEQLMLRLREYVGELNLAWREATRAEDLDRRLAEVVALMDCIRSIWAYGRPRNRPQLKGVLAAADDFVDQLPAGVQPTVIDLGRAQSQMRVRGARRIFWFGAGVWLTKQAEENRIDAGDFAQLWENDIAPSFQRPEQAWEAWGDYFGPDVLGWCRLRAAEEAAGQGIAGQPQLLAGPDDGTASAAPALALMLRHSNFAGMPRTLDDQLLFQTYMWNAAKLLFGSETTPWAQIASKLPADAGSRFQSLRDAVM